MGSIEVKKCYNIGIAMKKVGIIVKFKLRDYVDTFGGGEI